MQYEIVIKGDRWRSCYTCLPRTAPSAAQSAEKMTLGTGTDASPVDQRLLTFATPKQVHTYTYMQIQANTKKKYNNT